MAIKQSSRFVHKINILNPATWLKPDEKLMCGEYDISWMYVIFADMTNHPKYKVSSEGQVWKKFVDRHSRRKGWHPVYHGYKDKGKYVGVFITDYKGERKAFLVHALVLSYFFGLPHGNRKECQSRHLNGNGLDNRLSNLVWGTAVENARDRKRHGTEYRGSKHSKTHFTEDDVLAIVEEYKAGTKQSFLAIKYKTRQVTISNIVTGVSWGYLTGIKRRKRKVIYLD